MNDDDNYRGLNVYDMRIYSLWLGLLLLFEILHQIYWHYNILVQTMQNLWIRHSSCKNYHFSPRDNFFGLISKNYYGIIFIRISWVRNLCEWRAWLRGSAVVREKEWRRREKEDREEKERNEVFRFWILNL